MRNLLDQNVSRLAASFLRNHGFDATDARDQGLLNAADEAVWVRAVELKAVFATRDFHFTNRFRFDPTNCGGIILVTPGDLKVAEEIELLLKFFDESWSDNLTGKLVQLSPKQIRVR